MSKRTRSTAPLPSRYPAREHLLMNLRVLRGLIATQDVETATTFLRGIEATWQEPTEVRSKLLRELARERGLQVLDGGRTDA